MDEYTGNEVFQLLLKNDEVLSVLDDWLDRNMQSDLRVRRAKTKGFVVVETRDVLFARNIKVWHPSCQVAIRK